MNNNIGEAGAVAIGNNLKQLTTLKISTQCINLDNSDIGETGAVAIANNLKQLTTLNICT